MTGKFAGVIPIMPRSAIHAAGGSVGVECPGRNREPLRNPLVCRRRSGPRGIDSGNQVSHDARLTWKVSDASNKLNKAYREKFGFPSVVCVRKTQRRQSWPAVKNASKTRRLRKKRQDFGRSSTSQTSAWDIVDGGCWGGGWGLPGGEGSAS